MMTVKQLKEAIANAPDDMPVAIVFSHNYEKIAPTVFGAAKVTSRDPHNHRPIDGPGEQVFAIFER